MGRAVLVFALLSGCGRFAFDPTAVTGDASAAADSTTDAVPQRTVPVGPKIWLQMETGPDPTMGGIIDSAGNHITGCAGPCASRTAGTRGSGYRFSMQEIHVENAQDLDASTGFTGAVWLDLNSFPTTSVVCPWSKPFGGGASFDTFTLCVGPTGKTKFDSETQGGVANTFDGPSIELHKWHHLAMSWDGLTQRSYLDGVQVSELPASIGTGSDAFSLGGERGAYHIDGIVDDAIYYTRALSNPEIALLAAP
jgi:hypothetical protein